MAAVRKKYVITTRYGKEEFAERELGDSVFPFDENVEIHRTRFGGVLVLYTSLNLDELLRALSTHPPATVERVVKVDFCCKIASVSELSRCLVNGLRGFGSERCSDILFGRKGALGDDGVRLIVNVVRNFLRYSKESELVLHVEPVNDEVCFGIMKRGIDKVARIRAKKIGIISHLLKGKKYRY
ncbi:MAG: hypothetical protein DRO09_02940 [Thermoprotei archaeon]|nr:MAG: hypothetical protein DRO09_02940 [Thermoprotei archaeon]